MPPKPSQEKTVEGNVKSLHQISGDGFEIVLSVHEKKPEAVKGE
jgi:hypothetical protein